MTDDIVTIGIAEGSELAQLLAEADTHPVRVMAGTATYRIVREKAPAPVDASTYKATIDRLAGSWSAEDADAAIAYIYKAREEGSRPADRP